MKNWNLKVESSRQDIMQKLKSSFQSLDGFVFLTDDSSIFKLHKRVSYPDQILHRNRVVVKGKILDQDDTNQSSLEISFSQHLYTIVTIITTVIFALVLIVIISGIKSGVVKLVGTGIILWGALKKKFDRDIHAYKKLIGGILESE